MFLVMGITLFTSRIVLSTLGIEDFGIYNVVGGIVAMSGIMNGAMSVSAQRYLTFEIGRGDHVRLKQVFNMCVYNPQIEMFARFKMKSSFHKTKRII